MAFELDQIKKRIAGELRKLSGREKVIVLVALGILSLFLMAQAATPIFEGFSRQSLEMTSATSEARRAAELLARYSKLRAKREAIEREYRDVAFDEGVLSFLEGMIRSRAGIPAGFTIKERDVKSFAGNYQQYPFTVKFETKDLRRLVDFLQELIGGDRPLVLSRLDILKSRPREDRLEVELDVSSIRRMK